MSALPWQNFRSAEPDSDYLVLASRLQLRGFLAVPGFFRLAGAVRKQLSETDGLIGYSLFTQVPRRTFYTLSAWEDRAALDAFVGAMPHSEVARKLKPQMADTLLEDSDHNQ